MSHRAVLVAVGGLDVDVAVNVLVPVPSVLVPSGIADCDADAPRASAAAERAGMPLSRAVARALDLFTS